MQEKQFRQGDVLVRQINTIPTNAAPHRPSGRIVLAYGEVTGHAHAILDLDKVEVYVGGEGQLYLRVAAPVELVHEEHGPITIPPGDYERIQQREYAPEAIRNVAD